MLSLVRLRPDGAERTYYERAVASSREDYYAGRGEADGEWTGSGARDLGLAGQLVDGDLTAILAGRHPGTGEQLRRLPEAREVTRTSIDPHTGDLVPRTVVHRPVSGFDLVFAAPKSVSLLYALATPDVQTQVAEAHRAAWRDALELLEDEAAVVRVGPGGVHRERAGLIAAGFQHRTSREGDPHLHTHVIVANMGRAADGRMRALDGQPLICDWRQAAGYLYQARLRHELTGRLGLRWSVVTNGQADLTLFPTEVLEEFSTRRRQVLAHAAAAGATTPRGLEIAQRATRPDKHHLDWSDAVETWRARATEHGFRNRDLTDLRAPAPNPAHPHPRAPHTHPSTGGTTARPESTPGAAPGGGPCSGAHLHAPTLPTETTIRGSLLDVDGLTATSQTFTQADILKAIAAAHPDGAPAHHLRTLAERIAADPEVVPTEGAVLGRAQRLTTRDMLTVERAGLACAVRGRGADTARAGSERLTQALERSDPPLSDEQAQVARMVADHPDRIGCVQGAAGAGKTTAIAAGADALHRAGIPVAGAAPSAQAAHTLAHATGLSAHTLHALLAAPERIPTNGVLVIDEASMADTRTLTAILHAVEERESRTVLVGDTHQLPAVGPGGLFAALIEREGAAGLEANHRQREQWEKEALRALRHGETEAALRAYAAHQRIEVCAEPVEAISRCVEDWWAAAQDGDMADAVMLAHRRAEVDALNHAARARARHAGALGPDVPVGNRAFAVGDRVIERRNDPTVGARNGRRGIIQAILPGYSLSVRDDDGTTTTLPADYAGKHLAHAYALTIHAAQGATVQHAFLLAPTSGALAELGYVALTRARQTTRLYLSQPSELGAVAERTPAPLDRLMEGLDRPATEPLATLTAPGHEPGSPSLSDRSRADALRLEP